MNNRLIIGFAVLLSITVLVIGIPITAADGDVNVGILRVSVEHPRFAAPSSHVSFLIDAEYAVHDNASIKSRLFGGTLNNPGPELWHSDPVLINGPMLGDQVWVVNFTAPTKEGEWQFVAFAYYRNAGKYSPNDTSNNETSWSYYNDTDHGPSFLEFAVKVSQTAQLEVDLGVSNAPVTIGNLSMKTSNGGVVASPFNVGQNVTVSVPAVVTLGNSTRFVFQNWQGGSNSTETSVSLDGDIKLTAIYTPQYLLQVTSAASTYAQSSWHHPGSNVTLEVASSAPMDWPWGSLGLRYLFKGWTGDVTSNSNKITLVMDKPKVVTANFTPDPIQLIFPLIVVGGVVGGVALSVVRRRATKSGPAEEQAVEEVDEPEETAPLPDEQVTPEGTAPQEGLTKFCDGCGESVEEDWTHCIHCGKSLRGPSEPVQS